MRHKPECCAIIVAAGNSTRMGSISKQLMPLCDIPVIIRTISAFENSEIIDNIVIVCRQEDISLISGYIKKYKLKKVFKIVKGGSTRQQSVEAGIREAKITAEYFAIHDGARPLITEQEITASVKDCIKYKASALAVPVKDTIKIIGHDNFIKSTPQRSLLWAVQTPQVFERNLYLKALEKAKNENMDYTDDCQLVEHIGTKVHLCTGTYTNIKLTTLEDVYIAESILKSREEGK